MLMGCQGQLAEKIFIFTPYALPTEAIDNGKMSMGRALGGKQKFFLPAALDLL
jgi:hypothetical protein